LPWLAANEEDGMFDLTKTQFTECAFAQPDQSDISPASKISWKQTLTLHPVQIVTCFSPVY